MLVEIDHSLAGTVKTIGLAVKFSATPGEVRHGAPVLGEHSRDILAEHGYSGAEIEALARDRVGLLVEPREQGTKR